MADQEEKPSGPLEDRLNHKNWKWRVNGYEELTNKFKQAEDGTGPLYNEYGPQFKKFLADANPMAQEKCLDTLAAFIDRCDCVNKFAPSFTSILVDKCFPSSRPKVKDKTIELLLATIEADSPEPVIESILKGTTNTSPKILVASIVALREALKTFGPKVVQVKLILKQYAPWFENRDKNVRDEASALIVEVYRWMGKAVLPLLESLTAIQLKALTEAFEKLPGEPAVPLKYMRSEAAKAMAAAKAGLPQQQAKVEEIDPYSLIDAVNILSKITNEFYEGMEQKKWQLRQEQMDKLVTLLTNSPKIENGDYNELCKSLKKTLADTNIMIATKAITAIGLLAEGLRGAFASQAKQFVAPLLTLYKEKKPATLKSIHTTMEQLVSRTLNLSDMIEDITTVMTNKIPQTKQEVLTFIHHAITETKKPQDITKISKQLAKIFLESLNDTAEPVRDATAKAFGALGGVIGERGMTPYLNQLDAIKQKKIREFMPEVQAVAMPVAAPVPVAVDVSEIDLGGGKKPAASKKASTTGGATSPKVPTKEDLVPKLTPIIDAAVLENLGNANLKDKLQALDDLTNIIQNNGGDSLSQYSENIIQFIQEKPGWKDQPFQVNTALLNTFTLLARNDTNFSKNAITLCINNVIDKLIDVKAKDAAVECLLSFCEAVSPQFVFSLVYGYAAGHKNFKVTQDTLAWMSLGIEEFGIDNLLLKPLFDFLKGCLDSPKAEVKQAAIKTICTVRLSIGPSVIDYLSDIKKQLLDAVEKETIKMKDQRALPPTRSYRMAANIDEIIPRTDISGKITGVVLSNLGDQDWKVRQSALEELERIVIDANLKIQPKLGQLITQLTKGCLVDKNQKVVTTSLALISLLTQAIGAPFDKAIKMLLPGIGALLADSKKPIRDAAIGCLNAMVEQMGAIDIFIGAMAGVLNQDSATSRKEALNWIVQHIGTLRTGSDCPQLAKPIVQCLQDKNSEVRAMTETIISHVYVHIPASEFKKELRDVKPAQINTIQPVIEKYYKNKPPPPSRDSSGSNSSSAASLSNSLTRAGGAAIAKLSPNKQQPLSGTAGSKSPSITTTTTTTTTTNRQQQQQVDFILNNPNGKKERQKNQQQMWYFQDPSDQEIIESLQEMALSCFSEEFSNMMFSANPQHAQQVVDLLSAVCENNTQELLNVVDVIFRWITFKLFDMGLTSLKRTLKLLETILTKMAQIEYMMSDYEVSCLVPILSEKCGTSNETFKAGLKQCYKLLSEVCPPQSHFRYTMEVIRSSNWRTRVESITECGILINQHGGGVCGNLKITIPTLAKLLGDREQSVKTAVLNTLNQLYQHIGDEIWKYLPNVSQNDRAILQQQFGSSGPSPTSGNAPASKASPSTSGNAAQTKGPMPTDEESQRIYECLEELRGFNRENIDQIVELLKQISGVVSSAKAPYAEKFLYFSEDYLVVLCDMLGTIFPEVFADPSIFRLCKYLIHTIITIYSNEIIAKRATTKSLETVLTYAMKLLVNQPESQPQQQADLEWVTKALNQVLLRTLQNSNNTTLFSALLRMKTKSKSIKVDNAEKYSDLLLRCLLRATKSLRSLEPGSKEVEELDIKVILAEINAFLADNHQQLDDTNKKTTKTLTSELINVKGKEVYAHCKKIIASNLHQKYQYLFALLTELLGGKDAFEQAIGIIPSNQQQQQQQQQISSPDMDLSPTTLSANNNNNNNNKVKQTNSQELLKDMGQLGVSPLQTPEILTQQNITIPKYNMPQAGNKTTSHLQTIMEKVNKAPRNFGGRTVEKQKDLLIEIFKKIGDKELTMEGIYDLYYFKQQYPDFDTEPNLRQTTTPFQSYVNRNLARVSETIQQEEQNQQPTSTSNSKDDVHIYSEKLKEIQNTMLAAGYNQQPRDSNGNQLPPTPQQQDIQNTTSMALNTLQRIRSGGNYQPISTTTPTSSTPSTTTTTHHYTSSNTTSTQDLTSTVASLRQKLANIKESSRSND